jgi:acetolactate synthase-1/2/3 large subunit
MPDGAIQPGSVVRAIRLALASQDLLFADTGYMAAWTGALYPVTSTGRVYHRAVGSLGWAFAASLGGTFAADGRRVACVIGDGGFGYHVGDIETALRHDLDTTIVILNNQSLAFEYHIQKYQYGGRIVPQVNDFVDVDYAAVATAFGAWGQRVTDPADLDDAVRAATSHPGLAILDVAVDKEAIAPVTVYDAQLTRAL